MGFNDCVRRVINSVPALTCWDNTRESEQNYRSRVTSNINSLTQGIGGCIDQNAPDDTSLNIFRDRLRVNFTESMDYCGGTQKTSIFSDRVVNTSLTPSEQRIARIRGDADQRLFRLGYQAPNWKTIFLPGIIFGGIVSLVSLATSMVKNSTIPIAASGRVLNLIKPHVSAYSLALFTGAIALSSFFVSTHDVQRVIENTKKGYPPISSAFAGLVGGTAALYASTGICNSSSFLSTLLNNKNIWDTLSNKGLVAMGMGLVVGYGVYSLYEHYYPQTQS